MDLGLRGKVAFIAASSRGLGRAVAPDRTRRAAVETTIATQTSPGTPNAQTASLNEFHLDRDFVINTGSLKTCNPTALVGTTTDFAKSSACPGTQVGQGDATLCSSAGGCGADGNHTVAPFLRGEDEAPDSLIDRLVNVQDERLADVEMPRIESPDSRNPVFWMSTTGRLPPCSPRAETIDFPMIARRRTAAPRHRKGLPGRRPCVPSSFRCRWPYLPVVTARSTLTGVPSSSRLRPFGWRIHEGVSHTPASR